MTLTCNCDMPMKAYCDWLRLQGWDCSDMEEEPVVGCYSRRLDGNDGNGVRCWLENYPVNSDRGDAAGFVATTGNSSY